MKGLSLLIVAMALTSLSGLHATDFYWDADTSLDGNQNGSDTWTSENTFLNWTTAAALSGSVNLPWVNANDSIAHLGASTGYSNAGMGGSLTLGENITLNQLRMGSQAGAYSILAGGANSSLIFSGIEPVLHNEATSSLSIQAGWHAASGLIKTGTGCVIFNAPAGSNTGSGSLAIQQGTVQLVAADTLPTGMNVVLGNLTTAGSLEVDFDQTIAGLSFQSRSADVTNSVNIAEDTTLTIMAR